MDNQHDSTQISGNSCKGIQIQKVEENVYLKKYTGILVEMSYEEYKRLKEIEANFPLLQKKVKNLKLEYQQQLQEKEKEVDELKLINQKILSRCKALESLYNTTKEKLSSFENPRKGKLKFTLPMQEYVISAIAHGKSIVEAYDLMRIKFNNPDVSYETVRRYVSTVRNNS